MKRRKIVGYPRISLLALLISVGGCTITIGPLDETKGGSDENPPVLPAPKPPGGGTPGPGGDGPVLDPTQQTKKDEADHYIAEVIYQGGTILESIQLPSGDVIDFIDRSTLPALPPDGLPPLPFADADLTLPPGVELGQSELEKIPELLALAAKATPFLRPTFWPYILGETDATSIEDYLNRYQVGGQPTGSEHLYAGLMVQAPNRGISGFMNQFRPEVEPGSFSLIEFAVSCPAVGPAQEMVGVVISVDKVNPFGKKGQALTDGEPRMHVEYARVDPTNGQVRYKWDGTDGEFKPNFFRTRHQPGETVPVSVLGGTQVEHLAAIFQTPTGDWWIAYQGELLGYYPGSLFKQLNGGACRTQWYGEVARWKPATAKGWSKTEMGSGKFAAEGLLNAAYVRNPRYYDSLWFGVEPQGSELY